jgi:hypothetical protein
MTELTDLQRRAAELQAQIENAPDEQTAQPLADELRRLFDSTEDVHVLHTPDDDY